MFYKKYEKPPSFSLAWKMRKFAKSHPEILSYKFSTWSVGVKGDARVYQPSLIIKLDSEFVKDTDKVANLSTEITNKVNGISRVLLEIESTE